MFLNKCVNLTRGVAVQFPAEKYYFVKVVILYHYSGNWCKLKNADFKSQGYVGKICLLIFLWLYLSQCYISCFWRPRWPHCKLRVHLTGSSHDRWSLHANNFSVFPPFFFFFLKVFLPKFVLCFSEGEGWLNCWAPSNQILTVFANNPKNLLLFLN